MATKSEMVEDLLKTEAYRKASFASLMKFSKGQLQTKHGEIYRGVVSKQNSQQIIFCEPTDILKRGVSIPLDEVLKVVFKDRKATLLLHLE
jgi:hypothetical protein